MWHGRDLRQYKRLLSPPLERLLTCPGKSRVWGISQSVSQTVSQSVRQSVRQSVSQSDNQSIRQSVSQSDSQSVV